MPKGREAVPEYSLWQGKKYGYVSARKKIYCPLYAECVSKTIAFSELKKLCKSGKHKRVYLVDFDGYDEVSLGMSLHDVLNCSTKKVKLVLGSLTFLARSQTFERWDMRSCSR